MKTSTAELRTSACAIDAERSSNKAFFENADKPTLHGLSYALRHPDTWPKGFVWDFRNCKTCAMGLARSLWSEVRFSGREHNQNRVAASVVARTFAMPFAKVQDIFLGDIYDVPLKTAGHLWWRKHKPDWNVVTPEMVADQIDKYIATAE